MSNSNPHFKSFGEMRKDFQDFWNDNQMLDDSQDVFNKKKNWNKDLEKSSLESSR